MRWTSSHRPEYAQKPNAYVRLLAHEMAHRLHVAVLRGNEDAMGPVWFYEGFAVVASGDLLSPAIHEQAFWRAIQAKRSGSYKEYAKALRLLMEKIPLPQLVSHAGEADFLHWIRQQLADHQGPFSRAAPQSSPPSTR